MADSPLRWHGKPILTVALAAVRYRIDQAAMRAAVRRPPLKQLPPIDPPPIDARTPVWYQKDLDLAWADRPGKGAPGVPRSAPDVRARRAGGAE